MERVYFVVYGFEHCCLGPLELFKGLGPLELFKVKYFDSIVVMCVRKSFWPTVLTCIPLCHWSFNLNGKKFVLFQIWIFMRYNISFN